MPSAQGREITQAGSAPSVVSHGVVGVAACRGPSAAGIGTGGMPDLNQVAQPRGGPVRSRLPGMITVATRQEREAEGPRLAGCAGLRFTGRASSGSVTWTVRRPVTRAERRSVTWAAPRRVTWTICRPVTWDAPRSVPWTVCRSVTWAACRSAARAGSLFTRWSGASASVGDGAAV